MRASCIGVFNNIDDVLDKTTIQCRLTHDTADGIAAARASSLMSHYFLYDLGMKQDVGKFLERYIAGHKWNEDYVGKVKAQGWMSVRAAITAVKRNDKLSELLKDCINFSGDVDTVATIALSAASCSKEYTKDLPDKLVWTLEGGKYGREYLIELDKKLMGIVKR